MAAPAAAPPQEQQEARKPSIFVAFARLKGDTDWTPLPKTYEGITQDHAKKAAAQALGKLADDHKLVAFRDALAKEGGGIQIAAVSKRVWQPLDVGLVAQPPKLVIGS